jgi:hypothetical protein
VALEGGEGLAVAVPQPRCPVIGSSAPLWAPYAPVRFADGRTDMPVGSRPGFVIDANGGQEVRDQAYRQSVEDLRNAWRGAADTTPSPLGAPMSVADAVRTDMKTLMARLEDARHTAYFEYCRELKEAWRR